MKKLSIFVLPVFFLAFFFSSRIGAPSNSCLDIIYQLRKKVSVPLLIVPATRVFKVESAVPTMESKIDKMLKWIQWKPLLQISQGKHVK